MYDIDRAAEVLRHGPNTFAEKKDLRFQGRLGALSVQKGKSKNEKIFRLKKVNILRNILEMKKLLQTIVHGMMVKYQPCYRSLT